MRWTWRETALLIGLAAWVGFLYIFGPMVVRAGASPAPTPAQAVARLVSLTNREQLLDQRYNGLTEDLSAGRERLASITRQEAHDRARFAAERRKAAVIAAQAYEAGLTSYAGLLMTDDPQRILDKGSILLELSSGRTDVMRQLVAAARQLRNSERAERGATEAIGHMREQAGSQRRVLVRLVVAQRALLASITPREQGPVIPGGGGGGSYHGPLRTRAQHAVAYAYAQLGKPYQWGATGPASFDCSGLVMEAWLHAGVQIPRTTFAQWAGLVHVPFSSLRPGDLLLFNGLEHVGIYVGHGFLIDAPHSGADVEKVALAGWYLSALDGVVRP
jgi:peptidoglycan DL-endopeptidase CwlO